MTTTTCDTPQRKTKPVTHNQTKGPNRRAMLEMENGDFWPARKLKEQPNGQELFDSALVVIAMHLKDALWGIAPLLGPGGRDLLLSMCLKIINEDRPGWSSDGQL